MGIENQFWLPRVILAQSKLRTEVRKRQLMFCPKVIGGHKNGSPTGRSVEGGVTLLWGQSQTSRIWVDSEGEEMGMVVDRRRW